MGRPRHGGRGLKWAMLNVYPAKPGRPPHGGRGLKYIGRLGEKGVLSVALLTGGVD